MGTGLEFSNFRERNWPQSDRWKDGSWIVLEKQFQSHGIGTYHYGWKGLARYELGCIESKVKEPW